MYTNHSTMLTSLTSLCTCAGMWFWRRRGRSEEDPPPRLRDDPDHVPGSRHPPRPGGLSRPLPPPAGDRPGAPRGVLRVCRHRQKVRQQWFIRTLCHQIFQPSECINWFESLIPGWGPTQWRQMENGRTRRSATPQAFQLHLRERLKLKLFSSNISIRLKLDFLVLNLISGLFMIWISCVSECPSTVHHHYNALTTWKWCFQTIKSRQPRRRGQGCWGMERMMWFDVMQGMQSQPVSQPLIHPSSHLTVSHLSTRHPSPIRHRLD